MLAGFSLGEADLLRRAMGKKIKSEMDAQRAGFVEGCARVNAIPAAKANELFDLIDKFAGYGFNKSHAAAYALVAYQTAWLKAHHPVEFYAASMCFDMAQTDKLAIFVDDMRRMGVDLPAARDQRERGGVRGRAAWRGSRRPLRARRAEGRRREGDGAAGRRAARQRPVRQPRRFRRADRSAGCSTAARSRASPAAARSTASPSAGRSSPRPRRSSPPPPAPPTRGSAGRAACSARGRPMSSRSACRRPRPGRSPSAWRPRRRASASISPPIRSTITAISPPPMARGASPSSPRCRRRPTAAAPAR